MRYTFITPTLVRDTLKRLCDSIDSQTNTDWEHVVVIDCVLSEHQNEIIQSIAPNPRRQFVTCTTKHVKDYGNAARRQAFDLAQGDYILDIDDDDYYADDKVLDTLMKVTAVWAVFPVLAYGKRCHPPKPEKYRTGSAMFMYRRDTGMKFPDNTSYSADGELVEQLKAAYPYQSLDDERELVIYPRHNRGMTQEEINERRRLQKPNYASDGLTLEWQG